MYNQTEKVNIRPKSDLPVFRVSEGDVGRTLTAHLVSDDGDISIPAGATVTMAGTKPSGLGYTVAGTVDGSDVSFNTDAVMTDEPGRIVSEIRIVQGDTLIGTTNVVLSVEPNPHPDDTTDGRREPLVNEITALLHAIEEQAEQVADNARAVEQAMDAWTNMSAEAETLPAGSDATASYSEGVLSLGIPAGPEGTPGQDGQDGVGIANVQLNSDYTLTITLTDGRTYTTTSIRGEQGETGLTPDFAIGTVTTLAPGSQATATITGTDEEPVLNLGIPKGDPGDVNADGYYPDLYAGGLTTDKGKVDKAPYLFRASPSLGYNYNREIDQIVGGTVAWNQLASASATSVTVQSGHKYIAKIGGAWSVAASSGSTISVTGGTDMLIDLTALFNPTIADYIYSLEQANAGAGVAWFRQYFPKDYYPYDPGTLRSVEGVSAHETVGFNLWDEEWEFGYWNMGNKVSSPSNIRSKNKIPILPNTTYYCNKAFYFTYYDENGDFLPRSGYDPQGRYQTLGASVFTTPSNAYYMTFNMGSVYGTTYKNDICINISKTTGSPKNGDYVPYEKRTCPLDSDLTLRGIPKLDASNNLYYDGDTYVSDGTVTRKYGVVDLGTLDWGRNNTNQFYTNLPTPSVNNTIKMICPKYPASINGAYAANEDKILTINGDNGTRLWARDTAYSSSSDFKTALSGVYLVYELATPTTESAQAYTNPQVVDDGGTEEYVTSGIVPVGHVTKYPEDLRSKTEGLPWDLSMIAPIENGTTASKAYLAGQYFLKDNRFCKAKTAIASGATFTLGTNYEVTTVATELYAAMQ